jgi:tRNA (cytidine/uridine-2'-O-)-methyltransferase
VLLTTKAEASFLEFSFRADDILIAGRESAGVPEHVHATCAARVSVPMRAGVRSLNVAVASGMVLSEALRQTGLYPTTEA